MVLGFIGVGTITAAMVRGLAQRGSDIDILLSPRSEETSRALASQVPRVRRAGSNAEVAEASQMVVLAMRPPQFESALADVVFRDDQIVLSCLANTALDRVRSVVTPARVARFLPLPTIERGAGPIAIHPPLPEALDVFGGLGDIIPLDTEAEFRAVGGASAGMSTFFALQAAAIRWLAANGPNDAKAKTYIRSMYRALAETGATTAEEPDALVRGHETPGGINERTRMTLERGGWFDAFGTALDALSGVSAEQLKPGWHEAPSDR